MDAKVIEWIIGGPLIVLLLIPSYIAVEQSNQRLDDPNDNRTAEQIVTGTAQEALRVALATFRRAGIPAVHVGENGREKLRFGRGQGVE